MIGAGTGVDEAVHTRLRHGSSVLDSFMKRNGYPNRTRL